MPVDTEISTKQWYRFQFVRDNGHSEYIAKAEQCNRFFRGQQWDDKDLEKLKPAVQP